MTSSWLDLLAAAVSGGGVVKILDYLHTELLRRRDRTEHARELVDKHLDPILKAADELVGKARSLAAAQPGGIPVRSRSTIL